MLFFKYLIALKNIFYGYAQNMVYVDKLPHIHKRQPLSHTVITTRTDNDMII